MDQILMDLGTLSLMLFIAVGAGCGFMIEMRRGFYMLGSHIVSMAYATFAGGALGLCAWLLMVGTGYLTVIALS